MNKKIKIIELLNKIANGEEVPNKIEYQEEVYEWDKEVSKYADHLGYTLEIYTKKIDLHEEVEILEDNTEEIEEIDIQDIQELKDYEYNIGEMSDTEIARYHNLRSFKINQLVKAVKKLDKDINYIDN